MVPARLQLCKAAERWALIQARPGIAYRAFPGSPRRRIGGAAPCQYRFPIGNYAVAK